MSKFNLALTGENKVIDCLEQKDWKKKKRKNEKKISEQLLPGSQALSICVHQVNWKLWFFCKNDYF